MVRNAKRPGRAPRRREDAATKLLAIGGAFLVLPWVLGNSPLVQLFRSLMPLGVLMLLAGAGLLWLQRRQAAPPPSPLFQASSTLAGTTLRPPRRRSEPDTGPDTQPMAEEPAASTPARPASWTAEVFSMIEWRRFEAVVETLFQQGGFETRAQSHGADGGVDVWLYSRHQPGAAVSLVQCKHWQGKRVGVDKVRELRGVMAANSVTRGQFACTSTFTPDAVAFAKANGIHLLDADGLLALIAKRSPEQQQALLAMALEGDYWRPTCVKCGLKMLERQPRKSERPFWGCSAYPRCHHRMTMARG